MPAHCLKRPCAIFDEFEPVRKIRLIDHNFEKTGIGIDQRQRLSVPGENLITTRHIRQTTCIVVPTKRKRQVLPDGDLHRQFTFQSSRKRAKMVIQARNPTSVDDMCDDSSDGGVCFDDSVSGRPRRLGLERSDGIIRSKSSAAKDTDHVEAIAEDEAAVFNCFNFWRCPVPEVDLYDELCPESEDVDVAEVDNMVYSDHTAAPSGDDGAEYSDFTFWKIPMEILDLD